MAYVDTNGDGVMTDAEKEAALGRAVSEGKITQEEADRIRAEHLPKKEEKKEEN